MIQLFDFVNQSIHDRHTPLAFFFLANQLRARASALAADIQNIYPGGVDLVDPHLV